MAAKRKGGRKPRSKVAARSIGNILDCDSLAEVKRRFDADAERMKTERPDSEALDLAAGHWLGYPGFLSNVLFLYDGDDTEKYRTRLALDRAHDAATNLLMATAEREGIDSGGMMESARLCRAMLADADNFRLCLGSGTWPECLTELRGDLPTSTWETAQRGYAALARLSARLSIKPQTERKRHLTEPMTQTDIARWFGCHRNQVKKNVLGEYWHEKVGGRFRMNVVDMPTAYHVHHTQQPRPAS